jgi:hypothetical protein
MTMTNFKLAVGAAVALVALPLAACAQPADPQAPATDQSQPGAPGGMTLQEFVARGERRMMAADTDGDGKISRAEFMASAKSGREDPAKRFARWDRNGDGALDKAEIEAMLTKRFRHMDANGDGVLTPDERAAARPGRGARAADGSAP